MVRKACCIPRGKLGLCNPSHPATPLLFNITQHQSFMPFVLSLLYILKYEKRPQITHVGELSWSIFAILVVKINVKDNKLMHTNINNMFVKKKKTNNSLFSKTNNRQNLVGEGLCLAEASWPHPAWLCWDAAYSAAAGELPGSLGSGQD